MATPTVANGTADKLPPDSVIFGKSERMRSVHQMLQRVASANVPVLIRGESGTGKEIMANLVHHYSPWSDGPFVKVNCPAIPGTLLESELFGYERGAFTGAYGVKPGRVEMAHLGTLFLDEIAELDPSIQAKLLQLLQDGQFCRIGSQQDKRVDARVVCATNRDIEMEIDNGTFRQDLFYRINVLTIELPRLRDRREDIPTLVEYFVQSFSEKYSCRAKPISSRTLQKLQAFHWPGNIRQLENLMKRYVIYGSEETISSELMEADRLSTDLVAEIPGDGNVSLKVLTKRAVRELERKIIYKALQANHWNRKRAARSLNISYRALLYKMKEANASATPLAGEGPAASQD